MSKFSRILLALTFISLCALQAITCAQDTPKVIKGTISQTIATGVLTLELPNPTPTKPAVLQDFLVTADVGLFLDNNPVKLSDLTKGMAVRITPSTGDLPPQKIEVFVAAADGDSHEMKGSIETMSDSSISVMVDERARTVAAVKIVKNTKMTLDGKPTTASDIKRRMYSIVSFQNGEAQTITATTLVNDGKSHRVKGTVSAVADGKLTISTYGGPPVGFNVVLRTNSRVRVVKETTPLALTDLREGLDITATYLGSVVTDVVITP